VNVDVNNPDSDDDNDDDDADIFSGSARIDRSMSTTPAIKSRRAQHGKTNSSPSPPVPG